MQLQCTHAHDEIGNGRYFVSGWIYNLPNSRLVSDELIESEKYAQQRVITDQIVWCKIASQLFIICLALNWV